MSPPQVSTEGRRTALREQRLPTAPTQAMNSPASPWPREMTLPLTGPKLGLRPRPSPPVPASAEVSIQQLTP